MITDSATAAHLYRKSWMGGEEAGAPPVNAPDAGAAGSGASFADTMTDLVQEAIGAVDAAEGAAMQGMAGQGDPHSVVEALAAAELALETAVTVRNKAVEAYQEILRMPV